MCLSSVNRFAVGKIKNKQFKILLFVFCIFYFKHKQFLFIYLVLSTRYFEFNSNIMVKPKNKPYTSPGKDDQLFINELIIVSLLGYPHFFCLHSPSVSDETSICFVQKHMHIHATAH